MLYQIHQRYMEAISPVNSWMQQIQMFCDQPWSPLHFSFVGQAAATTAELLVRSTGIYDRPEFNIEYIHIDGNKIAINEQVVVEKPYCKLLSFERNAQYDHPKLLIIAPMSGNYSTLLRGTVEHFIADHDVYITDWVNARDVPLSDGSFSFDDYVSYLIEFFRFLKGDFHIVAVCQATVPTLVAASVMAQRNANYQPKSMSLLGGPIDTRISPTEVNDFSVSNELEWFENNVICTVPDNFAGAGQKVYPGFIQLTGFLSKNLAFFGDLVKGDGESAENHRQFYNEYLAVMDMPAEYYLDTIRRVFIEHQLPQATMTYQGELVDCTAVNRVALMTIEGENDDITGAGQTRAAQQLLSGIPPEMKQHYLQPGVGHYGVFNGRRFRQEIGPRIKQFIAKYN